MKITLTLITIIFLLISAACLSLEGNRVPPINTNAPTPTASPSPAATPRVPYPGSTAGSNRKN